MNTRQMTDYLDSCEYYDFDDLDHILGNLMTMTDQDHITQKMVIAIANSQFWYELLEGLIEMKVKS